MDVCGLALRTGPVVHSELALCSDETMAASFNYSSADEAILLGAEE